ncbi:MAG: hypothetical protein CBD52_001705 [Euryarchaeota archaeon TMED192]|nr:MAG: hypothetical protein CBD52_001705 [Euryarchaeota archaeon TMED192]
MQAMVLAGGRSTRMGQDKSTLVLNGRALLTITIERLLQAGHSRIVILAADEQQKNSQKNTMDGLFGNIEWLLDPIPHQGLIEALVSGVRRSNFDQSQPLQLSAVDSPWLDHSIYPALQKALLGDTEVAIPADQRLHPLHSLVRSPSLLEGVNPNEGPLREQLRRRKSVIVPWSESELTNLNAPSDLER